SSGQEPYSLAMLIREHFRELDDWQISIVGTDVSAAMLDRARTGLYGQIEVNRGLPAHLLIKYFHRVGVRWELDARIRSMLRFPVQARSAPAEMNGTRHLSASVQISGGWDGTVLVSCAEDLARRVAATMFDVDESTTTDDEIRDALGEVANMTAGNVKALVESYCRLSIPMVAEGRELE